MVRKFQVVKISFAGSSKKNTKIVGATATGATPSAVAAKVFNASCKANKNTKKCQSTIIIQDVTPNARTNGKNYKYKVVRKFEPKTIDIAGKKVEFKYSTTLSAIKM